MSNRIDDRDKVVTPSRESLPEAIRDRHYTHAYPSDFRMNRGNVQIFGPTKAHAPARTLVLDRNRNDDDELDEIGVAGESQAVLEEPVELEATRSWAEDETEDYQAEWISIRR